MTDSAPPTFSDYAGGSLQSAFVSQWGALKAPGDKLVYLQATVASAQAAIDAAKFAL